MLGTKIDVRWLDVLSASSALGLVVMLGNCGGLISTWSYVSTGKKELIDVPCRELTAV